MFDSNQKLQRLTLILLISLTGSSCTNNYFSSFLNSGNQLIASNPNSIRPGSTSNTFFLARVVKNITRPALYLDLIGDGSGAFGKICAPASSSDPTAATGPTICTCAYSYTSASNPNQKPETPVEYHETDLLRCRYGDVIPADVQTFQVSVHATTGLDIYSNAVSFQFSGSSITIDPTSANSFQKVTRYLCGEGVSPPYPLDSKVYDPFQADTPQLTYPLNFYTASLGEAFEYYINSQASTQIRGSSTKMFWNCKPIPDTNQSVRPNMRISIPIFSAIALDGEKTIDPPSTEGTKDRSTFYVAKQATGIFNIPVNARIAPGVTSATGGSTPPLGYAAGSVYGGSQGSETCPDSKNIPSGFKWMKLWQFRAALPPRKIATIGSSPQGASLSSIACNPGDWNNSADPTTPAVMVPVLTGCQLTRTNDPTGALPPAGSGSGTGSTTFSGAELSTTAYLTDRVVGLLDSSGNVSGGLCAELSYRSFGQPDGSPNDCSTTSSPKKSGVGCGLPIFGQPNILGDQWLIRVPNPTLAVYSASNSYGCNSSPLVDPLNLCHNTSYPSGGSSIDVPRILGVSQSADIEDGNQRYDFIFVVTPPSINTTDMLNQGSSSPGLAYYPYRFFTSTDCLSNDPDHPSSSSDCRLENAITNYGLKLHDISTNGDPPASDPQRNGVFPVCVLQKEG